MATPLLTTKLYIPPVRPELVSRPRLIERLNEGLHRKLTLISAPAGFGKTTLLSEWIHHRGAVTAPLQVAWLSLDEGDNDPAHFLAYFIAAIQTIHQDIGQSVFAASQSFQPLSIQALLTTLINEIAAMLERFALVLDDYHLITAQPIHDGLTFLLDHLPPQLHLVIATRADPHLPLARLRARGQLTELRQSDLHFTTDEAAAFLNRVMGLNLSPDHVTALESRTEIRAACQSPLTITS
jgi:LuxR family maltose regulon positive regulatory protein